MPESCLAWGSNSANPNLSKDSRAIPESSHTREAYLIDSSQGKAANSRIARQSFWGA